MNNRNVDMLNGSITKGLVALTLPIMVMNVVQNLFSILDMTLLGNWVGDGALGAVGACSMLITLCTCLLIGISSGTNIIVAKHMGAQDNERTEKAVGTAMIIAIMGGLSLMVLGTIFARPLLQLTNCPGELIDDAALYFRLYFISVPFLMLYNFSASILRAIGDSKSPMYFLLLGSGLKVLANILFIKVLHMEVDGAGVATILANVVSGSLCIWALRKSSLQFRFRKMRFCKQEWKSIFQVGIPIGLQNAAYAFANVVIITAVNSFGPDATTGVTIAGQLDGLIYYICFSPSQAISPYVAQNVGARNLGRAKKALLRIIALTVLVGGTLGAFASVFSRELASIMTSSPAVIAYAQQKIALAAATYFICGINDILAGTLCGLGKPIVPAISTLLFLCLLRFVWVYAIFPLCPPNLTFLYLVWPIGWVLSILMLLLFYFPTVAKLERQNA